MSDRLRNIKINLIGGKRYYNRLKYPEITPTINDLYIVTTVGDRLDLLANRFYGDTQLWWVIAMANIGKVRRDSFALKSNLEIRIPSNLRSILRDFDELNANINTNY
tara:strand:+ start:369 stop:689 length:321 start_codon:yes stop_codon:yes gene_type:complete